MLFASKVAAALVFPLNLSILLGLLALGFARRRSGRLAAASGALALLVLVVVVAAALVARRLAGAARGFATRGLPPASAAYRRLQKALRRRGAELTPASAPAETLASADRVGAGRVSREIVRAYVAESFGGRPTPPAEEARLAGLLRELRSAPRTR